MCSLSVHGSRRSCHGNAGALLQPALPFLWRRIVPGAAWGSNYGDLPSPLFSPPRAFMYRLVNHLPLTSHLISSRLFCQAASLPSSTSKRRGAAEAWGQMGAGHAARIGIRRGQRHRRLRHGPGYPPPPLFEEREREREVPSFFIFSSPPCLYPPSLFRFCFDLFFH